MSKKLDYIYIISDGVGNIKIGVARNPYRRLHALQTGNTNKLTLYHFEEFTVSRDIVLKIERKIHQEIGMFCPHVSGEWYRLGDFDIESVKKLLIYYQIRQDSFNTQKYLLI